MRSIGQADIIAYAQSRQEFSRREMFRCFRKDNLEFSPATVTSCLLALTDAGIIKKKERGIYALADVRRRPFVPFFDKEMQDLESVVRENFRFVRFCVWSSSDIKRFSHYVVNLDVIYVDVEREAVEPVFAFLLNANTERRVFLNPSNDDYTYYIYGKPAIVVRTLVSEAPVIAYSGDSNRLSLEKLLVDIAVDKDFVSFHDYESLRFYRNAMDACIVNETKLLRYAKRRGCREKIKDIFDTALKNEILD
jgi:hypothetical protein